MATYKRYRKEDQVSYSLGITLTFELLKFKKESVTRVFIHSGMKKGDTLDKLILKLTWKWSIRIRSFMYCRRKKTVM